MEETAGHAAVVLCGADYGDWACCGRPRASSPAASQPSWQWPMRVLASSADVRDAFAGLWLRCTRLAAQPVPAGGSSSSTGDRRGRRTAVVFIAVALEAAPVSSGRA